LKAQFSLQSLSFMDFRTRQFGQRIALGKSLFKGEKSMLRISKSFIIALVIVGCLNRPVQAQSLNWEGQTGTVIIPDARVSESPARGIGHPVVSFHVLNGGEVLGNHFQTSLTIGVAQRIEFGVSRSSVASINSGGLNTLFDRGFTTIHAKVNMLAENAGSKCTPGISAGVLTRWQQKHLEGALGVATQNADLYVVATKSVPVKGRVSAIFTGGVKATNASLLGLAGNAPGWSTRAFGAAGVSVSEALVMGVDLSQQSAKIDGVLATTDLPATVAYYVRFIPIKARLNIDIGVVRLGNTIAPGLDIKANNQLTVGASFRF
jgi:hypothetical protein